MRELMQVRESVATIEGAAPPTTMCVGDLILAVLGTDTVAIRAKVVALIDGRTPRELAIMSTDELRARGLSRAQAERVRAAFLLGRHGFDAKIKRGALLRASADIFQHFHARLRDEKREHFIAVMFDGKNRVMREYEVSTGILTASLVHPREVFAPAIRSSAAGIVLVHNHPSGDPEPSPEDHEVTRRLVAVGELVGIRILDHVVVGDGRYVSFLERGLIS